MIKINVPGVPIPQSRPRFTKTGHVYEDIKCREYKAEVGFIAKKMMGSCEPFSGQVEVCLTFYLPIPKSWSLKQKEDAMTGKRGHTKKPDWDNLAKAVTDAMNGIVYHDDAQIVRASVFKQYGDDPRVEICVESID